jgi:hypothetical protein
MNYAKKTIDFSNELCKKKTIDFIYITNNTPKKKTKKIAKKTLKVK